VSERGELAVVVYALDDGDWRPTQVFTRRWLRFADGSEGWSYTLFDGNWCRRDETLHLYNTGGGPPNVVRGAEPGIHWRIWLAEGESVSDGGVTHERPPGAPLAWQCLGLTPAELFERGYEITTEHPGDIFADASDERTYYCETCDDHLPADDATACEHYVSCHACGSQYGHGGDDEARCRECNASQHNCEFCTDYGGEVCISCGQWVCAGCWTGHDSDDGRPCERGRPDWKEPGSAPPCEECEDADATRCPAETCGRPLCAGCNPHHTDSTGEPCEAAKDRS
jgi:hypothetical protein